MKKVLIVTWALLGVTLCVNAQKIKGSDTVLPLSEKEAQAFMKNNKGNKVMVTGGGSGVGIAALIEGTTDIAQTSRKIKFSERQKIQNKGKTVKEVIIGYDALAVIINNGNGINQLTKEQLEGIFTGKIKNWKEVGGADLKIIPLARETSSGTYEFFKEKVMENKNYFSGIRSLPATGAIIQSVSQTKGAIAYVGIAYLNNSVKALSISFNNGKSYIKPTEENTKNKLYPIIRPLYYYYLTSSESKVKNFINFVLSFEGQKIVQTVGYISTK
ncbi:MAG: phosphate ABC transporter substrate-binding protein [Crocinitomicaceae bacterium]|nr:phosphate ABC transporter substrate-binding protein [Crocinitomicaceae bacterium]